MTSNYVFQTNHGIQNQALILGVRKQRNLDQRLGKLFQMQLKIGMHLYLLSIIYFNPRLLQQILQILSLPSSLQQQSLDYSCYHKVDEIYCSQSHEVIFCKAIHYRLPKMVSWREANLFVTFFSEVQSQGKASKQFLPSFLPFILRDAKSVGISLKLQVSENANWQKYQLSQVHISVFQFNEIKALQSQYVEQSCQSIKEDYYALNYKRIPPPRESQAREEIAIGFILAQLLTISFTVQAQ
ncbi:hypothetical protein FGO68_gene2750 [Halteria grandinella]|uniref:Uncharacterized protein n=1 Tax=Halteria grandinella TaxID=5974 RepID=A0A8J8NCQ6_HALGN|nr:hypothetical protein FGO68_gene2750 [Halteria grandinella]